MNDIDKLCINTIRFLSADAVQQANSGHPGTPMGLAPVAYTLWTKHLRHSPKNPKWHNRDRFVLSCGHSSMLLYSLLHLTGYDVSLDDLKNFRQWNSKTPGHPEFGHTPGVETTTGPLGAGTANSVGMAIAETMLAQRFNTGNEHLINHHTYAIVSDGDLMEGISSEAASLAGHLKLGKLIWIYDDNSITIDGTTDLSFSEDVGKRFESYGWHVQTVQDGNQDLAAIDHAIQKAKTTEDKPSLIVVKTTIGFGAPNKQHTSGAHGSPLGEEEIQAAKKELGFDHPEAFSIPEEVQEAFSTITSKGEEQEQAWNTLFETYKQDSPDIAQQYEQAMSGELPEKWDADLPTWSTEDKQATRKSSGAVLQQLAKNIPSLVQGSADLHPSTNTYFKESSDYQADKRDGRNLHYGIREHAMGGIQNGMALHGGVIPLCSTFLVFSDYMRPTIRLAALMNIKSIFVYTHDSVGVGEDGPTHQPVEHYAALRSIPNNIILRPGDANETRAAWKIALQQQGPSCLLLTRQGLPILTDAVPDLDNQVAKGAYILQDCDGVPEVIVLASGSEVQWAIGAQQELAKENISVRVVSMPSWELFEQQSAEYKESVLPAQVTKRVSVESGVSQGWERYVGLQGRCVSLDRFGASAPGDKVMAEFGFSTENVVKVIKELL